MKHKGQEVSISLSQKGEQEALWGKIISLGALTFSGEFPSNLDPSVDIATIKVDGRFGVKIGSDGKFKGIGMTLVHTNPLSINPWPTAA